MSAKQHGSPLPFKVLSAIRNHAFKDGMVLADVTVSVEGGTSSDWIATAVYVAEHSIVEDANVAKVFVIVANNDGDSAPRMITELAEAYYDPDVRIWKKQWSIFAAEHAATQADIKYFVLSNDLLDPNIDDPEKQQRKADAEARARVVREFHLPSTWKSGVDRLGYFGFTGKEYTRSDVDIAPPTTNLAGSLEQLKGCLTENRNGTRSLSGCMPTR